MRTLRKIKVQDSDPLQGLANFFDLGIVFALAFMLALMLRLKQNVIPVTVGKQSVKSNEVIKKERRKPKKFRVSKNKLSGEGQRLGTAYQLKSGEIIYVPD